MGEPPQDRGRRTARSTGDEGLLDRVPPHSEEAEIAVLGAAMIDNIAAGLAVEELEPEDFYKGSHAKIFEVIAALYDSGEKADIIAVHEELSQRKLSDSVGGPGYLREITDQVPSSANVEYYCRIVKEKALLRDLIRTSSQTLEDIFRSSYDPREVLDLAEQRVYEVAANRTGGGEIASMGDVLKETFRQLEEQQQKGRGIVTGLRTGYNDLDEILGGMRDGELLVLAARPSMGKTTLGLNIALNVAAPLQAASEDSRGVLIFSLEMNQQQLVRNMLSVASGVDGHRIRRNYLDDKDWTALSEHGLGRLGDAPIYLDDSPSIGPLEIGAKARRMQRSHDVGLIIVDYLQLVRGPRVDSREQQVSSISRSLKAIARELSVPLIAVAQLNRKAADRGDNRPMLSDLRESGAIEQDADVVMLLHRPDYYSSENEGDASPTDLIVAKQRNGPTGTVKLSFIRDVLQFKDYAPEPVYP